MQHNLRLRERERGRERESKITDAVATKRKKGHEGRENRVKIQPMWELLNTIRLH